MGILYELKSLRLGGFVSSIIKKAEYVPLFFSIFNCIESPLDNFPISLMIKLHDRTLYFEFFVHVDTFFFVKKLI